MRQKMPKAFRLDNLLGIRRLYSSTAGSRAAILTWATENHHQHQHLGLVVGRNLAMTASMSVAKVRNMVIVNCHHPHRCRGLMFRA